MTKLELAREIAARTKPRFIAIDRKEGRVYRETAMINTLAKLAAKRNAKTTAVLREEQERLIKTWDRD
jgi:hypothetical protein